jgi:hypothetical protein
MIDSSVVRVHQQAAAKKTSRRHLCPSKSWGLTTTLNLEVIGNDLPVQIGLSPGQMNDAPMAELERMLEPHGLTLIETAAVDLNPFTMRWRVGGSLAA